MNHLSPQEMKAKLKIQAYLDELLEKYIRPNHKSGGSVNAKEMAQKLQRMGRKNEARQKHKYGENVSKKIAFLNRKADPANNFSFLNQQAALGELKIQNAKKNRTIDEIRSRYNPDGTKRNENDALYKSFKIATINGYKNLNPNINNDAHLLYEIEKDKIKSLKTKMIHETNLSQQNKDNLKQQMIMNKAGRAFLKHHLADNAFGYQLREPGYFEKLKWKADQNNKVEENERRLAKFDIDHYYPYLRHLYNSAYKGMPTHSMVADNTARANNVDPVSEKDMMENIKVLEDAVHLQLSPDLNLDKFQMITPSENFFNHSKLHSDINGNKTHYTRYLPTSTDFENLVKSFKPTDRNLLKVFNATTKDQIDENELLTLADNYNKSLSNNPGKNGVGPQFNLKDFKTNIPAFKVMNKTLFGIGDQLIGSVEKRTPYHEVTNSEMNGQDSRRVFASGSGEFRANQNLSPDVKKFLENLYNATTCMDFYDKHDSLQQDKTVSSSPFNFISSDSIGNSLNSVNSAKRLKTPGYVPNPSKGTRYGNPSFTANLIPENKKSILFRHPNSLTTMADSYNAYYLPPPPNERDDFYHPIVYNHNGVSRVPTIASGDYTHNNGTKSLRYIRSDGTDPFERWLKYGKYVPSQQII